MVKKLVPSVGLLLLQSNLLHITLYIEKVYVLQLQR